MFFNLKFLKRGTVVVLTALSLPSFGQDLLARQAPIDKVMRAVDSVALQRLITTESMENPAFDLYQNWNNDYVHSRYSAAVPEEYKIDLRHFCMPTPSQRITSNYGYRRSFGRMHKGLDIKVYTGDTIYSAFNGKVRIVAYERGGYGKYIVIRHPNGLETIYGHLSKQMVRENQIVKAGEPIGLGGNTGLSTGSHLHFETRFMGQAINPAEMFDFVAQDVTGDFYLFRANGKGEVLSVSEASGRSNVMASVKEEKSDKATAEVKSSDKAGKKKAAAKVRYHKVRSGESLYVIAKKVGTTVDKLCKLNGISKRTKLRPGQILKYS